MAKTKEQDGRGRKRREAYPHVFNFLRPMTAEAALEFGQSVAAGKTPDPTRGIISAKEYVQIYDARDAALEAGTKLPSAPYRYQPLVFQAAVGGTVIVSGKESRFDRKPRNWDDKFGEWRKGMGIGTVRRCHKPLLRSLVVNPDENMIKIHSYEYVIGTPADTSAVFIVNASKTGNYGANIMAAKVLSFDGVNVNNLVAQVNNDFWTERVEDGTQPGPEIAWGPGMCVKQWGYLVRNDKRLTYAQIRKSIADGELTGIKFEPLEQPIVGKGFTKSPFWAEVKRAMSLASTKREDLTALDRFAERDTKEEVPTSDKAWRNLVDVQCRVVPDETFPFGFFSSQTGIVPVAYYNDEMEELGRMIIGSRIGYGYRESSHEAKRRLGLTKSATFVAPARKITAKVKVEPQVEPKAKMAPAVATSSSGRLTDEQEEARKARRRERDRERRAAAKNEQVAEPAAPVVSGTETVEEAPSEQPEPAQVE